MDPLDSGYIVCLPEQASLMGGLVDKDKSVSREAAALSQLGARKGGLARAERLDEETRREIALTAAAARWGDVHVATHVGELRIGDRTFECAVLEDGTRVINQTTMLAALGRHTEKSRRGDP